MDRGLVFSRSTISKTARSLMISAGKRRRAALSALPNLGIDSRPFLISCPSSPFNLSLIWGGSAPNPLSNTSPIVPTSKFSVLNEQHRILYLSHPVGLISIGGGGCAGACTAISTERNSGNSHSVPLQTAVENPSPDGLILSRGVSAGAMVRTSSRTRSAAQFARLQERVSLYSFDPVRLADPVIVTSMPLPDWRPRSTIKSLISPRASWCLGLRTNQSLTS